MIPRWPGFVRRPVVAVPGFVVIALVAIAAVVDKARHDAADPARCVGLVALGDRCCAEGQVLREGACKGRPLRCPAPLVITELGCVASVERVFIGGGVLHVGAGDWEAEGRVSTRQSVVAPFWLDSVEITEAAYAACVEAGQCSDVARTGEPGRALGGITRREAEAYCAFRGGRLPSDDEWIFGAAGSRARRYPWGDTGAVCRRAAWGLRDGPCGFGAVGPELAGTHPDGATPEGVRDLAGNVAEWVGGSNEGGRDDDPNGGLARGGSFLSSLATDLRTWQSRRIAASTRSPDVGARCAYDALPPAPAPVP